MEGTFHQMKGKLREIVEKLTDNPKLKAAGTYEKMSDIVQEKIGQVKKGFGDVVMRAAYHAPARPCPQEGVA